MTYQLLHGRQERLEIANRIIEAIASCGRRFLSMNSDRLNPQPDPRISRFELVNGRLYYVDKYRESRIFVHWDPRCRRGWGWRFSDGGTLLSLLQSLRDFILKNKPINLGHFGPFKEWVCGGDPWGYGADMETLRHRVAAILHPGSGAES